MEYDRQRAMKLKDFSTCVLCSKPMMHARGIFFFRVTIERMGINVPAASRQQGLEMMLGRAASLASIMGPDEDLGIPIGPADKGLICDECAVMSKLPIAGIAEAFSDRTEEERVRAEEGKKA